MQIDRSIAYLARRYGPLVGVGLFVGLLFPSAAYAQDSSFSKEIFDALDFIVKFISRGWVIPATIAGKLMTNDVIYASFMYFDRYLWRIWNFMKNAALFALGFFFIIHILKQFFKPEGAKGLGWLILRTALAGILIPMTWWLVAICIDFSIVLTATVSSVPHQVMQEQRDSLRQKPESLKRVEVEGRSFSELLNTANEDNIKTVEFDNILPRADNVAGSLVFLGASVLRLNDANFVSFEINGWKDLSIATLMKLLTLFVFFVPMVILMIVNMMRIFYIWLWIMFSPFLVLYRLFIEKGNEHAPSRFSIGNFFGLIFQPVVVVGLMSLGLVLIVGVYDILLVGNEYERGSLEELHYYVNDDNSAYIGPPELAQVKVEGDLFNHLGAQVGGLFGELILVLFVMFVLWGLVKAGFATNSMTKSTTDQLYGLANQSLETANFIPGVSVGTLKQAKNVVDRRKLGYEQQFATEGDRVADRLKDIFGMEGGMSAVDETALKQSYRNTKDRRGQAKDFWTEMQEILKEKSVQGSDPVLRESIQKWLLGGQGFKFLKDRTSIFGDSEIEEYQNNSKKISEVWKNRDFNKFVDYVLKNGWGDGTPHDDYTASAVQDISPHYYGKGA